MGNPQRRPLPDIAPPISETGPALPRIPEAPSAAAALDSALSQVRALAALPFAFTPQELWRWFTTGIPASLHMDEEDHAAFIGELRQKFARDVYLLSGMITVFNLLYWGTDKWLLATIPGAAKAFGATRAKLVVLAIITVTVHTLIPHRVYLVGISAGLTAFWLLGNLMGQVGPPSSAMFGFLYPFVLVMVGQWVTPLQRAGVVALSAISILSGYYLANPAWLSDPMVGSTLGYFFYVLLMGYLVGLFVDYSKVNYFMTQRDLKQARDHLEERVQERTQALHRMVAQMDRVQDTERARLARELHDEVGQLLTAQRLAMRLMKRRYSQRPEDIRPNLDQLEGLVEEVTAQFREVLRTQRPSVLDEIGLEKALQQLALRSSTRLELPCALHVHPSPLELGPELSLTIYRCVQEGVTNAVKHAQATRLEVEVRVKEDQVLVTVADDGVGIGSSGRGEGFGLLGIRERVLAQHGAVEVLTPPDGGTCVRIRLPISQGELT